MNTFHTDLSQNWSQYTIYEQMAHIGAEVGRSINWRNKGNDKMSKNAFYRALELIDITVADVKNRGRLSEILRMRELLVDYLIGENMYHSTDDQWSKYFIYYNFAARRYLST